MCFLVAADSCHETDFLEAWRNIDDSACVSTSFELVFFPLSHTNDLLLFLKLLDHMYGQVFWGGTADTASHNMVTTSALRYSRTGIFAHSRFSCGPGWTLQLYRKRSTMQTDAWKSQYGSPNNHCHAQQDLLLFFSFSPKICGEPPSRRTGFTMGAPRVEATSGCQ